MFDGVFFLMKIGSNKLLAQMVGYQVELPAIGIEDVVERNACRDVLAEFGLDGLYTVDAALPIVDEVANGPFGYFLPEECVSILDSVGEVSDVFLALLVVAFLNEDSIDALRIRCSLILFVSMN
jgi:hypothetical protein